ncbi:MAG TPA: MetQ/NlpA family ABC transporter substrate-binding protein [Waddliaceae bacterium]
MNTPFCKNLLWAGFIGIFFLVGCQSKEKTLKVAATPVPHAELLEMIKSDLNSQGIHLKIVEVDDYNLPNRLLFEKQVDANFFQHKPFLDEQNKRFGYNIKPLVAVHLEPLGIYSKKITSLDELREGAIVAVPSDPTNEARALALLSDVGLIELKSNISSLPTIYDIAENPKHLKIEEVDAAFLPRALPDVDLALIPTNFALQVFPDPIKDALALESVDSPYANIIAVRKEDLDKEEIQKLKRAITSDKIRHFIQEKYKSSIIPAF